MTENQELWLSGFPSDELERDTDAWRKAERAIASLANTFVPLQGVYVDAVFVALTDLRARIKKHIEGLEAEAADATCTVPNCDRPVRPGDDRSWCREHLWEYDARAEAESWEHARAVLNPLLEAVREVGSSPELATVLEEALAGVYASLEAARSNLELAQERLREEPGEKAPALQPENGGDRQSCA